MTDPGPPADFATQLAALRGQLARYTGETGALRARVERDSGQVLVLRLQVKKLAARLARALESRKPGQVPAPYWADLPTEEFRQQMAGLGQWVESFLRVHYPGYAARLPACWANHPEAVWELSTLRAEWVRVYGDKEARDLAGALTWHDRYLPGALGRLEAAIRCDMTGCRARRPRQP